MLIVSFPEVLSQQILAGIILAGRLGVDICLFVGSPFHLAFVVNLVCLRRSTGFIIIIIAIISIIIIMNIIMKYIFSIIVIVIVVVIVRSNFPDTLTWLRAKTGTLNVTYPLWRWGVTFHGLDVSHATPDVTPCRTSPPTPFFRMHLARNARCNTVSHLAAAGCIGLLLLLLCTITWLLPLWVLCLLLLLILFAWWWWWWW